MALLANSLNVEQTPTRTPLILLGWDVGDVNQEDDWIAFSCSLD